MRRRMWCVLVVILLSFMVLGCSSKSTKGISGGRTVEEAQAEANAANQAVKMKTKTADAKAEFQRSQGGASQEDMKARMKANTGGR